MCGVDGVAKENGAAYSRQRTAGTRQQTADKRLQTPLPRATVGAYEGMKSGTATIMATCMMVSVSKVCV
jgi:hypothetical protein